MSQGRTHCKKLLTRRDKSRQFHETRQGIRMTVWVNVNHPSKRRRNRYVCSFPTRGEQTTNATATDMLHGRLHNAQSTLRRKRHYPSGRAISYHREVTKFAELVWFRTIAKQSKLAEQWKDAHWVGKLKQVDEHLLVIKGLTRSAGAGRRQTRVEKWNLGSVKAVLNRIQKRKTSTEMDTSIDRQKYTMNQALNEHRRTPLCTRCARDAGARCRARFENIRTKEFAEKETANHAADVMLSSSGTTGSNSLRRRRWRGIMSAWMKISCQPWMCRWIKRPQQLLQSKEQQHNWLRTMLKAVLAIRRVLLDIKLSKQIQYCLLKQ